MGALLLVAARFLLPVMGLAGVEGELVQPLAKLLPASLAIFIGSVALIVFDLKRQTKLAARRAKRLVEEAELWSEDFVIGEEVESPQRDALFFQDQPADREEKSRSIGLPTAAPATVAESIGLSRRRVTAEIAKGLSAENADYGNGIRNDNRASLDGDVFARYQHLVESSLSSTAALHQLPPPLPEFAGRSFELAELYAARANREVRVLNIQGPGGVGKTTLALKLADQLAPHYPDAQFYIDLKGASAQMLSVAEAQSSVIRAYLPTVRPPENEAELDHLYASVLAGKRVLLLLDNAANAQQAAPLVAPEGCLTILTSRTYLSLPAMFIQQLEGLPHAEACELLKKIVPRIGDGAGKIAELCCHLPLALRLAASALTLNPELKIEDYVRRLEELQQSDGAIRAPMHAVDAALGLSYELLIPGLQKLWLMLAVFRDTFDVNAVASVCRLNPARAAGALDRLIACSMVERNRATGRFRLHDLMAQFAESHSSDEERTLARQRHSAHYQSVLHEADALYEQGGRFMKQGLELVDLEWRNIQAGQVWAATQAGNDRGACELCNSYPDAGKYVLDLRLHPRERIRWSESALSAARKLKRRKAAARHLVALGDSYADLAEVHHAIECYDQALDIAREAKDRRGEAEALSGLGAACYLSGNLGRARNLHGEAMKIFGSIGDRRGETKSLGDLGLAYFAQGDLRNADMLFDKQLKAAREIGDRRSESNALGGLGLSHYTMNDARRALEFFNQQLEITREIGDRRGEASALGNLGNAYANLKFYQQAIAFHEQSLTAAREIGDRRNEAAALGGLGVAEYLDGNAQRSIELLTNAFNIACQIGDLQSQARSLFNLSLALDKTGDRKQAIAQAKTAAELFQTTGHPYAHVVRKQLTDWGSQ
jgi:tetratricopeptide (TPR) repeat protein